MLRPDRGYALRWPRSFHLPQLELFAEQEHTLCYKSRRPFCIRVEQCRDPQARGRARTAQGSLASDAENTSPHPGRAPPRVKHIRER